MRPPDDIFTSVAPEEAVQLSRYAAGGIVLEVGSWVGFSTVTMAQTANHVHAVDWHQGDEHAGRQDTLPELWRNISRYHVRDKVTIHVGISEVVLPLFRPDTFDFAFIDAFHTVAAVRADALMVIPLVKVGGYIGFHDYDDKRFGVTEAVDELVAEDERIAWVGLIESLAVVRRL